MKRTFLLLRNLIILEVGNSIISNKFSDVTDTFLKAGSFTIDFDFIATLLIPKISHVLNNPSQN